MIQNITEIKNETVKQAVFLIMNKMATAPKAKGTDDIEILFVNGEDKETLITQMIKHGEKIGRSSFMRDAENIRHSEGVILIGAKPLVLDLDCGMCGVPTCKEALQQNRPCIFPIADMGIALGSGVSLAADLGIDNRIMYTVGEPAKQLHFFSNKKISIILGVPVAISSKNIFFDRK